jgi:predicted esterase
MMVTHLPHFDLIRRATLTLVVLAMVSAGCEGDQPGQPYAVASTVESHETTGQITVLEPDADGTWPVVYMLHGIGGTRQDMEQLGSSVAEQGNLVVTIDWDARQDTDAIILDLACSYNYGQSIAREHRGDPDRAVAVAYSASTIYALIAGTLPEPDVGGRAPEPCEIVDGDLTPPDHPARSPDVLVLIAPCLFEYQGQSFTVEPSGGNTDLQITIVSADEDTTCEPWQQRDAVKLLRQAGYDTTLVSVPDADHLSIVYRGEVDGEPVTDPDSAGGQRTTEAILDAIAAAPW